MKKMHLKCRLENDVHFSRPQCVKGLGTQLFPGSVPVARRQRYNQDNTFLAKPETNRTIAANAAGKLAVYELRNHGIFG